MGRKSRGFFSFLPHPHSPPSALSLALIAPLLLGALLAPSASDRFLRVAVDNSELGRETAAVSRLNQVGEKDVILQAFQISWESLGRECEDWIGPAGFGYVQVRVSRFPLLEVKLTAI